MTVPDRSKVEAALERTIVEPDGVVHQSSLRGDQALIVAAARAWLNTQPTEQMIEALKASPHAFVRTAYGRPPQLGQVVPGCYLVVRLGDACE